MKKLIFTLNLLLCSTALSAADTQFIISPAFLHFDYTEFSTSDQVLNSETGWLPGVEARFDHTFANDWLASIYTSFFRSMVNYDGQTQSGTPHTTDTGTEFFRLGAQLEKIIIKNTGLFVSVQSHQWERDIHDNNNISGITESYQWLEYSAGINYRYSINDKDNLKLNAGLLITRNAEIYVDLSRVNLGSTTLDIGDGTGARLKLDWNRQHNETMRYGLGLFFEGWDFGRSNTKATEGGSNIVYVTEPRSETRNIGLMFNFIYLI